jgi:F-type H+-transporting ATPase subunit b
MQFDWWTFALQAFNFLVLVWLLWRFLYRPVKDVIEQRKQLAEEAFTEADRKQAEAEAARQRFEDERAKLAAERQDLIKKLHQESEDAGRKVLEKAETEANALIEEARKSIEAQRQTVLSEIQSEISELAVQLASEILRKSDPGAANQALIERFEKKIAEMPANEVDRLKKDLSANDARITLVTAGSLSPEERERWAGALGKSLGMKDKTDFATDPEILGGAELRFPHAAIKLTWADQLAQARAALQENETAS